MCASVCLLERRSVDVRIEGTSRGGFYTSHAQQARESPSCTWLQLFYGQIHLTCIRIEFFLAGLAHGATFPLFFGGERRRTFSSLSLHFGKKKCGCEERRCSRSRLLYIARGQLAQRHAATALGFRVPQKTLVMAELYILFGETRT